MISIDFRSISNDFEWISMNFIISHSKNNDSNRLPETYMKIAPVPYIPVHFFVPEQDIGFLDGRFDWFSMLFDVSQLFCGDFQKIFTDF